MAKGEKCSDLDLIETGLSPPIFQGLNVSSVEGSSCGLDRIPVKNLSPRLNERTRVKHMFQRSGGSTSYQTRRQVLSFSGNRSIKNHHSPEWKSSRPFRVAIWHHLSSWKKQKTKNKKHRYFTTKTLGHIQKDVYKDIYHCLIYNTEKSETNNMVHREQDVLSFLKNSIPHYKRRSTHERKWGRKRFKTYYRVKKLNKNQRAE